MRDIIFLPGFLLNLVCLRLKFKPLNRQSNEAAWILMFNILERRKEWLHPIFGQSTVCSILFQRENIHLILNSTAEEQFCWKALMLISIKKANVFSTNNIQQFLWMLILLLLISLLWWTKAYMNDGYSDWIVWEHVWGNLCNTFKGKTNKG